MAIIVFEASMTARVDLSLPSHIVGAFIRMRKNPHPRLSRETNSLDSLESAGFPLSRNDEF
jgi:hypothetical protein